MSAPEPGWFQHHRVAGAILTGFGVAAFWMAQAYPRGTAEEPGPAYYPLVVAALLMLFGTLVVLFDGPSARVRLSEFWERGRPLAMLSLLAAAALLVERVGFRITLMLLLFVLLAIIERVNLLVALAITAILPLGAFALLHGLLKLNLPTGPFGF
jgi:hypothetical protein